ncbi:MAG TPA: 30S ribosomal protein S15 [Candidatus Paceibacterota bacterium]
MLTTRKKQNVISEYQIHEKDTGSANVQVGVLSRRIDELTGHLKKNPKDQHSRRGLLMMVSQRRRLLKYMEKNDAKSYVSVTRKLGLKK